MPYQRMKFAVGLFVIASTLLFGVLLYVVLDKKGVFEEHGRFDFYARSAESIHIGMPVRYSGFEIGSIDTIELTEEGRVHATVAIKQEHLKWIRRNSVLRLEKPLIGSATIDVLTNVEEPLLESGTSLRFVVQDDINDIIEKIEPVIKDLQNIVVSINRMSEKLASDEGDLFVSLHQIRLFSDRLVEDEGLLTTLTGDPEATRRLKSTLGESERAVRAISTTTRELRDNVVTPSKESMKQLDAILQDVSSKLKTLEGTVEALGSYDRDLVELKGDIRSGVERATNLIDRVNTMLGETHPAQAELP